MPLLDKIEEEYNPVEMISFENRVYQRLKIGYCSK